MRLRLFDGLASRRGLWRPLTSEPALLMELVEACRGPAGKSSEDRLLMETGI